MVIYKKNVVYMNTVPARLGTITQHVHNKQKFSDHAADANHNMSQSPVLGRGGKKPQPYIKTLQDKHPWQGGI